jgi:hypothetical protein
MSPSKQLKERRAKIRLRKGLDELVQCVSEADLERDPKQRSILGAFLGRNPEGLEFVTDVKEMSVVGFLPVMVLGSDPEQSQDRALEKGLQGLCQPNRGECLIEAVQGPCKKPRLLTGGHK